MQGTLEYMIMHGGYLDVGFASMIELIFNSLVTL